jgi:hypothetical protein
MVANELLGFIFENARVVCPEFVDYLDFASGEKEVCNYKSRILLRSAARMAAEHSSQQTIPREPLRAA